MKPIRSLKFTSLILFLMFLVIFPGCGGITTPGISQDTMSAAITANPTSGEAPLEVAFDASESSAAQGNEIVSYKWDFGDDKTGEGGTVHHGFSSPGNYTVILTISDDKGTVDTSSAIIKVFQPSETIVEQTFDAQDGIEFDTGTGLKIIVPPISTEEQMNLEVKYNSNPLQPVSDFINLYSTYSITTTPQKVFREKELMTSGMNKYQETTQISLIFDVPEDVDPQSLAIFEWTDEGWCLAGAGDIGTIGQLGGVLSPDDRYLSIEVPVENSLSTPAVANINIFGIGDFIHNVVEFYFGEGAVVCPVMSEVFVDNGNPIVIEKKVYFQSYNLEVFGSGIGIPYKVGILNNSNNLIINDDYPDWDQTYSGPYQILGSSEWYLMPSDDENEKGVLTLQFGSEGGECTVWLKADGVVLFEMWLLSIIPGVKISATLADIFVMYIENAGNYLMGDSVDTDKLANETIKMLEKLGVEMAKQGIDLHLYGQALSLGWDLGDLIKIVVTYLKTTRSPQNPCGFKSPGYWEWKITVPPIKNNPPIANAGPDQTVQVNTLVSLDGSASYDNDIDDQLSYNWIQTKGPEIDSFLNTNISPTFKPTEIGIYEFELIINDGKDDSEPDNVIINVIESITTKPDPPTPLSPGSSSAPGTVIDTLTPTLEWQTVSGADYYALAISEYPYGTSNIIYNPQQLYGSSVTIPSGVLESGKKYRWNMQSYNNNSALLSDISNTLYFQILPSNYPPIITSTPITSATVGQAYSYDVNATDADGDARTYSLTTKPNGMTINSTTGLITWTPIAIGDYNVTVEVSDGIAAVTQSFTITVTSVNPETYTITASAGSNGSISPSGNITVNQGSDQSFTITPDSGYSIDDVLVDGSSVGAVSSHTFTNVTEDHTISATFKSSDVISATIISYSPSSKITVDTGQSFIISTSFKNTGNTSAYFYAGASVWDSSGNIIFNDWGGKTYLNKDQQGSASWSHTINTPGEYWLQFGVWDETKSELFDKKPSPSQNLIKVEEPPTTSATIISYSPSSKITVDTGQQFTISTSFKNTGNTSAYFYAGASVWDSSGNIIFNDWGGKTYLNKDQQGSASWSHTINTPGEYWLQFGVWDETKSELFDKKPSPSQNLIKVEEPPTTSATIISYSPSSKITVDTGQSFTISTSFKNTGNTSAYFYAGASVWDSSGNIVFNDWGGKTYLNKDQQGSASWSHTINTPGEYWLQFGVWDETKSELLDKKPSPSQNLIKVEEPPTTSATIISYSPSSKITVDTGQSFTISTSFKNTGNTSAYFYAGASVWDSSGNIVFNDWGGKTYLNKDQQGSASWSHTINTPGEYWLQFGVWDETKSELFDKKPSPSQNLIKVEEPPTTSATIISYSPSSKITVDTGQQFTISTSFKNTGNTSAYFYAGASVWDSSGNIVFNDWGGKTYLNKDQQGSASWSHTINTPGEYWLQFGVWDETKSELLDKKPSPSQNLIKVEEPPTTSATIISYSPSSKITVDTGQSFTISTSFKNTGNTSAYFYAGASVWDSSGNIVFNDWGGKTYLNKDQQGSASWSHTINTPGEYWLQFGVWDETKSELFDKKPSPSQNLIKVEEPPTTSATIISYSPSSKITVDTGQSFTISTSFKNTGNTSAYFYAGASVWDSSGNIVFNDWGGKTYLNKDQQGSASWSHTINTPGEYWLQFGVWDETKSELLDKKPSPSQNLIKVDSITQLAPQVTGVDPSQPTANPSKQWITILGNNFVGGAQVTLQIISSVYPIPEDRTQFIDSTRIKVYVGLTDSGNWKVWITNPDGQKSNEYIFYVKP